MYTQLIFKLPLPPNAELPGQGGKAGKARRGRHDFGPDSTAEGVKQGGKRAKLTLAELQAAVAPKEEGAEKAEGAQVRMYVPHQYMGSVRWHAPTSAWSVPSCIGR